MYVGGRVVQDVDAQPANHLHHDPALHPVNPGETRAKIPHPAKPQSIKTQPFPVNAALYTPLTSAVLIPDTPAKAISSRQARRTTANFDQP